MTTATVETLTASVNVLQVGSRQITLSVARQLDEVSRDEIEPFGRIRLGDKLRTGQSVIGKHRIDGTLVTSDFPRAFTPQMYTDEDAALVEKYKSLPLIVLAGLK